jgi:hypothetical protein
MTEATTKAAELTKRGMARTRAGQKTRDFLDHPEILTIPEARYLKCAVLECLYVQKPHSRERELSHSPNLWRWRS